MRRDRNHEGYHDQTAGHAIRRVYRERRIRKSGTSLTYHLKDTDGFRNAVKSLNMKG